MKRVNLLSIIGLYNNLSSTNNALFCEALKHYGIVGVKDHEFECLIGLVNNIKSVNKDISLLSNYYLGYSIPQIGKEFDLLRIGRNSVINIELKTNSTIEKIEKQLLRNKYYLSFLCKDLYMYTYVKDENKLFKLLIGASGNSCEEVKFSELCDKLNKQEVEDIINIDNLFNPSNYLVSPFNSTESFMNEQYFLTKHQEEIYRKIENELLGDNNFIALIGGAGTGKTLLTYHIAKHKMSEGVKVLILHCGQLNSGQYKLKNDWEWDVYMSKDMSKIIYFDIIIVDEAQRIYPRLFDDLINLINDNNKKCIFSFDDKQYLRGSERDNKISDKISELCIPHKLTDKIRTNQEIASFISKLFNISSKANVNEYPNVHLMYSVNDEMTKKIIYGLIKEGWKNPNYTPGTISTFHYENYSSNDNDSAHSVIGQEFDKIAVVIDDKFKFDELRKLVANNEYYSQSQMLYQIVTRTRRKLCLVIKNNQLILKRCLAILNNTSLSE